MNGVKVSGKVTGHDAFSLVLERDRQSQLVYKSAISTIIPHRPLSLGN